MGRTHTIGDILRDSLVIWRRGWFSQSVLCFVVFCPLVMLDTIKASGGSQYLDLLRYLYHFLALSALQAAMMHLIVMFAREEPSDIQEAIDVISPRLWEIISTVLYVGGKVFLGMLLLVVPGLMWLYKYLFVSQEVLFGAQTTKEAMENSARLTDGYKLKMLGVHLIFLIISGLVSFGLRASLSKFLLLTIGINSVLILFTLQYLLTSVVSSVSLTFFSLLYLRRREEVYGQSAQASVQTLMTSISSANPASAASLLTKYKRVHKQLAPQGRRGSELILR